MAVSPLFPLLLLVLMSSRTSRACNSEGELACVACQSAVDYLIEAQGKGYSNGSACSFALQRCREFTTDKYLQASCGFIMVQSCTDMQKALRGGLSPDKLCSRFPGGFNPIQNYCCESAWANYTKTLAIFPCYWKAQPLEFYGINPVMYTCDFVPDFLVMKNISRHLRVVKTEANVYSATGAAGWNMTMGNRQYWPWLLTKNRSCSAISHPNNCTVPGGAFDHITFGRAQYIPFRVDIFVQTHGTATPASLGLELGHFYVLPDPDYVFGVAHFSDRKDEHSKDNGRVVED